ncbi:MAG TPA: circadian clock KaiB family protein [Miltoncostaeaceae bacterium]|nr:circadian clock KaiB family protein [Miltoncostaeaceae bacterium]
MSGPIRLTLFVAGRSLRSERAIRNLRALCDTDLDGLSTVHIVDVLERPQEAEDRRIVATPTLVRDAPPPQLRVIGDLSDRERVLRGLGLSAAGA